MMTEWRSVGRSNYTENIFVMWLVELDDFLNSKWEKLKWIMAKSENFSGDDGCYSSGNRYNPSSSSFPLLLWVGIYF